MVPGQRGLRDSFQQTVSADNLREEQGQGKRGAAAGSTARAKENLAAETAVAQGVLSQVGSSIKELYFE